MKREFVIEKGFQVVVFFLMDFWQNFLKKEMVEKGLINQKKLNPRELETATLKEKAKDDLHDDYHFIFATVCGDPAGPGSYFKEVVRKRMEIPSTQRCHELTFDEDMLFQLAIDFCSYFNAKFEEYGEECKRRGSLCFVINWLEDMKKHPEKHQAEWDMWENTIEYVYSPGDKHLIL